MTARVAHLITEKAFQEAVVQVARIHRWLVFHPYDSRRSRAGWPDLCLLRPPDALFVELKREDGKLRAEQAHVLETLEACGLTVAVWRPSQLDEIIARLSEPRS